MSLCRRCEKGFNTPQYYKLKPLASIVKLNGTVYTIILFCSRNFILSALPADFDGMCWNTIKYNGLH